MKNKWYNNIFLRGVLPLLLLSGLVVSCVPHSDLLEPKQQSDLSEGERFEAIVTINTDSLIHQQLRADINTIEEVKSLRVLVFDESQNFLYSEDVSELGQTIEKDNLVDANFLPDEKQDGIKRVRQFKVSLVKSSKKRYIHFVANHDWTGFTQDYFAKGTSAGEFMTDKSLVDTYEELRGNDPSKLSLWSVVEANEGLDENTFKDKVVKLLRTYAKLTIKMADGICDQNQDECFVLTGFALCNLPNKGTIAPFLTSVYTYSFPFPPVRATMPTEFELLNKEESITSNSGLEFVNVSDPKSETAPYYLFEKDNTRDDHKTFVIIKGKRKNIKTGVNEERYYKVDLVTRKQALAGNVKEDEKAGINTYFPILRNKYYIVNINSIKSDGYKTIKEAIDSPAGNNVFADTKLSEYGNISDGYFKLSVDPISVVIVKSGVYSFNVGYSGGNTHVKYYPSWDVTPDLSHEGYKETGYFYGSAKDPYMGSLRPVMDKDSSNPPVGFEVEVLNIPTDRAVDYKVEVAALRQHNNKWVVDGVTGATSPLSRTVHITVRPPFPFNAKLDGVGDNRNLSFQVYDETQFPKAVFPFPVYIEAAGLTPVNAGSKQNVTVENIYNAERKKIITYYKYIVQETDQNLKGGRVSIPFRVNNPTNGSGTVRLTSNFYRSELIQGKEEELVRSLIRLQNDEPWGDRQNLTPVLGSAQVLFTFNGEDLNEYQLQTKYGISFKPIDRGSYDNGYFMLEAPKSFIETHGTKELTVKTTILKNPNSGKVEYFFSGKKAVNEWANRMDTRPVQASLELHSVRITGRVYYTDRYGYPQNKPKDGTFMAADWYGSNPIDLTANFNIHDYRYWDSNGIWYYNFTLDVNDPAKLKAFTERGYFWLQYDKNYSYSYRSLVDLEGDPVFRITLYQ